MANETQKSGQSGIVFKFKQTAITIQELLDKIQELPNLEGLTDLFNEKVDKEYKEVSGYTPYEGDSPIEWLPYYLRHSGAGIWWLLQKYSEDDSYGSMMSKPVFLTPGSSIKILPKIEDEDLSILIWNLNYLGTISELADEIVLTEVGGKIIQVEGSEFTVVDGGWYSLAKPNSIEEDIYKDHSVEILKEVDSKEILSTVINKLLGYQDSIQLPITGNQVSETTDSVTIKVYSKNYPKGFLSINIPKATKTTSGFMSKEDKGLLQYALPSMVIHTPTQVQFLNQGLSTIGLLTIGEVTDTKAGVLSAQQYQNLTRLLRNFKYLGEFSTSGEGEQAALSFAHIPEYILMYYIVKRGTNSAVGVIEQYVVDANNWDTDQYLHWNGNIYYRRVQSATASAWVPLATPTQAQWNEVNTKATDAKDGVTNINSLIPAQATQTNQLADKNFVNSSIGTNTANYISNNGQPFASVAELEAYSGTITNNDYAFVVGTDASGNTTYTRYKYNANTQQWAAEYVLNNSSFTAEQWATIQSGITIEDVRKVRDLPFAADIPVSGQIGAGGFEFFNKFNTLLFVIPFANNTGGGLISLEYLNRFLNLGTKTELDEKFAAKQDKLPLSTSSGRTDNLKMVLGNSQVTSSGGVSLGFGHNVSGINATAIGSRNTNRAEASFTAGYNNQNNPEAKCGGTIGEYLLILNRGEVALGRYNSSQSNQLFSVGCGTSNDDRKNAIEVDMDGKVSFPQENTSITDLVTRAKKIPSDVSRTATDATFVHVENGTQTTLFHLRQATTLLAGLMTAADKTKLDNLSQEIESLKQRIAALEGNA